jgi:2'-5' RNA ligase
MKTINSIPGYQVYEYLLVLTPHEELWGRIMKVKEEFAEKYKTGHARWTRPHVVLASFQQYAMMEERVVNRLKTIAMAFPPFRVEMKNYGSFPSHTIYINVTSKLPVQNLVKTVRAEAQRLMKMDEGNKPLFLLEPHITIGKKLVPWQYEKGWLEYSHKHFTGRFLADSMLLLKRPASESKFHVAEKFSFQNLPVTIKQGELFG